MALLVSHGVHEGAKVSREPSNGRCERRRFRSLKGRNLRIPTVVAHYY